MDLPMELKCHIAVCMNRRALSALRQTCSEMRDACNDTFSARHFKHLHISCLEEGLKWLEQIGSHHHLLGKLQSVDFYNLEFVYEHKDLKRTQSSRAALRRKQAKFECSEDLAVYIERFLNNCAREKVFPLVGLADGDLHEQPSLNAMTTQMSGVQKIQDRYQTRHAVCTTMCTAPFISAVLLGSGKSTAPLQQLDISTFSDLHCREDDRTIELAPTLLQKVGSAITVLKVAWIGSVDSTEGPSFGLGCFLRSANNLQDLCVTGRFSDAELYGAVGMHLKTKKLHRLELSGLWDTSAKCLLETLKNHCATLRALELRHFTLSDAAWKTLLYTLSIQLDLELFAFYNLMQEVLDDGMEKTLEGTASNFLFHEGTPEEVSLELAKLADTGEWFEDLDGGVVEDSTDSDSE